MLSPTEEIIWLAGLLEGEACFDLMRCSDKRKGGPEYFTPRVTVTMTDRDVIERVARIWDGRVTALKWRKDGAQRKQLYQTGVYGEKARWVLNQILPHMGERRTAKINEVLAHKPAYNRTLKTWAFLEDFKAFSHFSERANLTMREIFEKTNPEAVRIMNELTAAPFRNLSDSELFGVEPQW